MSKRNTIIPYDPWLKEYARKLRKNSTLSEIILWKHIKSKVWGVEFHRQVPILHYIVDFYCHELRLAIEIDGNSHDLKFESDHRRQIQLEKYNITFIRFTDLEVKQELFSVLLKLEQQIAELERKQG